MSARPFTTLGIPGTSAIETLESRRAAYPQSGEYPFLIGSAEELTRIHEAAEYNEWEFDDIIQNALSLDLSQWIQERREEAAKYEFSESDLQGEWPGEILDKGSASLHRDMLSGEFISEVFLGLARISEPWHLPAVLKYGEWNACPEPEVHCAFHRQWQSKFGAEITGMSSDIVECVVKRPPRDQAASLELAWQQYWYCADIVEQGCGTVSSLAATLITSNYWYFWWD